MSTPKAPVVINGWTIFAHPLFLDQIDALLGEVEQAKAKDPTGYIRKSCAKQLKMISELAFKIIPADPTHPEYRQGNTLGDNRKHWFRAKFFQQYRLFFRYRKEGRILVYAWVNDQGTKRAYGSRTDAYSIFRNMLKNGRPPDDWNTLLAEAQAASARLQVATDRLASPERQPTPDSRTSRS